MKRWMSMLLALSGGGSLMGDITSGSGGPAPPASSAIAACDTLEETYGAPALEAA